jgi:dTDP-4-amino-4,6-dideoxygalactose transaminase
MIVPFSPPDMSVEEVDLVSEVILSGWITTGPRTKEFERQIAAYCGTKAAVCLSSCTAAMEMALIVLGVGPGDEVIVPAYTFTATASPVCHVGAKLILIDSQPDSIEMDYQQLADAITERTKVIIPADIGGIVCDYDAVMGAVESRRHLFRPANDLQQAFGRVVVLADSAHAFGSHRNGLTAGAIADFTAFSFHAVKNLTTAEGGALTWRQHDGIDNAALYRQLQLMSLHGQSKDALEKTQLCTWEYDIAAPYYKCNMTDITAAIGLAQLHRYPDILRRRHELISRYDNAVSGLPVQTLSHFPSNGSASNGHLYMTRLLGRTLGQRNDVIRRMAECGVACNVHFKPLPMMTAYRRLGFDIKDFPHAYAMFENEVTLPLYSRMRDEEQQYVIDHFVEIIRS